MPGRYYKFEAHDSDGRAKFSITNTQELSNIARELAAYEPKKVRTPTHSSRPDFLVTRRRFFFWTPNILDVAYAPNELELRRCVRLAPAF